MQRDSFNDKDPCKPKEVSIFTEDFGLCDSDDDITEKDLNTLLKEEAEKLEKAEKKKSSRESVTPAKSTVFVLSNQMQNEIIELDTTSTEIVQTVKKIKKKKRMQKIF